MDRVKKLLSVFCTWGWNEILNEILNEIIDDFIKLKIVINHIRINTFVNISKK